MTAAYLGQELAHLDVRPKRAAYLTRSGSREQFRLAIERACSRWGGLQELIIPVSATGRCQPAWLQLLDVSRPDVCFDVSGLAGDGLEHIKRLIRTDLLEVRHEDFPQYGSHVLSVQPEPIPGGSVLRPARANVVNLAAAGDLASWDSVEEWSSAGVDVRIADDDVELGIAQLERRTVIESTAWHCGEVSTTNLTSLPLLVWVAENSSSLRDALWFWNVRALSPRSFRHTPDVLVTRAVAESDAFRTALHRALDQAGKQTTPDLFLNSLSVDRPRLANIRRRLQLDAHSGRTYSFHYGRRNEEGNSRTAAIQVEPRQFVIGERVPGRRASSLTAILQPVTTLRIQSPVPFAALGGHLRVRISGPTFLAIPERPAVAQLIHDHGEWRDGGLELEMTPDPLYQVQLRVPDQAAVLAAAVSPLQIEPSTAGRLAAAVLGVSSDPAIFRDVNLCRVIAAMTTPRSKSLVAELARQFPDAAQEARLEAIAAAIGPSVRQADHSLVSVASRSGVPRKAASLALERLAGRQLVERGLRVECSTCGLALFVALTATSARATCAGCGARGAYASQDGSGEPALFYRLNALLDRASDQGVLPHLYAWAEILERDQSSHAILGAMVRQDGVRDAEADLVGFSSGRVFAGEAKTTAGWYTTSQVKRDVALSCRLGADVHVIACLESLPKAVLEVVTAEAESAHVELLAITPT